MPSFAGMVVRIAFARVTPDRPSSRIARSTPPQEASANRVRRMSAVIFRRPYNPSGVIFRRVVPSVNVTVIHATSRTASTTSASVIVRVETRPCFQAR